ncbi:hypothetical protein, partial [Sphaerospermopsis aphanizomenoides]|uniref:hypothetical protein n=1 Tax=Sphaerospermopsis aphanizomenoides TaxID=459663 RepID=UPI001F3EA15C
QIDSIGDVNLWNVLIKFLNKQNLDVLYENLNHIHQEVKNAMDNYVCIMADHKEDNFLYLSPLLAIIVDVNILMNKLYKKDVQLFLMKQNSDSSSK